MKKFKILLTTAVFATLFGCVNSDEYKTPDTTLDCNDLTATKSVHDYTSTSTGTLVQNTTEDIIEAYVTSSDEGGNFYKSISFMSLDGLDGFSIPVDDYNLYTKFEPGRKVFINMKDRYILKDFGSTIIGSLYNNGTPNNTSDDDIGRIAGVEYQSVLTRSCTKENEDILVKHLTIAQAKNDQYLNMLIEFDGVQFSDESLGKKYFDESLNNLGSATNHLIKDIGGSSVILRASQFATFASAPIPSKNGKIRGVMTKFGSDYQFMIRTLNDVQLTNPRISPLFEETFTSTFGNWTAYSVIGAGQVWAYSASFGNPGACARMSGFATTNQNNEDWLISPAINLSSASNAFLTFDTASKFAGNPLKVYVSTNYPGTGNPNTVGTWTELTGFGLDLNTAAYVYTPSGLINISAYTGTSNFRVAFKYTSTTAAAATWELDNVKVTAN
ncbi:DUF5689 domain-containing protein [Flavobacterium sp.]|uniref:DUF5689 domain-containing protein n=1 Tax=Flavobacterium sp. TaxID=239 RepID=UPI003263B66D